MRGVAALWGLVVCACGPIQSRATLLDAAAELSAARAAQAELHAPFEFVAAEAYFDKAREEQSYADFETAVRFGRKSLACARAARMLSLTRAKESFGAAATKERVSTCRPGPDRGPGAPDFGVEIATPASVKAQEVPSGETPAEDGPSSAPGDGPEPVPELRSGSRGGAER